jgi:hypothetical protein
MHPANRPRFKRCAASNFLGKSLKDKFAGFLWNRTAGNAIRYSNDNGASIITARDLIDRDVTSLKDFLTVPQRILLASVSAKVLRISDINYQFDSF